jgi:RNA polymerase sigma-70 factor (ECF subfamily)
MIDDAASAAGNFSAAQASKEKETFDALMRREGPRIYALAVRLTGNVADGQDLAAETFVRAFRGFGAFRGEAAFASWVYRICLNLWKNRLRAQKRRRFWSHFSIGAAADDDDAPPLDPPSPEPPPDAAAETADRRRQVAAALDKLDPEDRAIVLMRETDDKSYEEIAGGLGIPLGTVKSRLARARGKLRALLEPMIEDPS